MQLRTDPRDKIGRFPSIWKMLRANQRDVWCDEPDHLVDTKHGAVFAVQTEPPSWLNTDRLHQRPLQMTGKERRGISRGH